MDFVIIYPKPYSIYLRGTIVPEGSADCKRTSQSGRALNRVKLPTASFPLGSVGSDLDIGFSV